MGGILVLRSHGSVAHYDDPEIDRMREVHDDEVGRWRTFALILASRQFPELGALPPPRPNDAIVCIECACRNRRRFFSYRRGMQPFIGEIRIFAGNFAPRGWALCDGQLLAINHNQVLFAVLGTTYGGDGQTTFALPDLRGRVTMHPGQGEGLSARRPGERGGAEVATQLPKGGSRGFSPGTIIPAIVPPFTAINHIIALEGVFPTRD